MCCTCNNNVSYSEIGLYVDCSLLTHIFIIVIYIVAIIIIITISAKIIILINTGKQRTVFSIEHHYHPMRLLNLSLV